MLGKLGNNLIIITADFDDFTKALVNAEKFVTTEDVLIEKGSQINTAFVERFRQRHAKKMQERIAEKLKTELFEGAVRFIFEEARE